MKTVRLYTRILRMQFPDGIVSYNLKMSLTGNPDKQTERQIEIRERINRYCKDINRQASSYKDIASFLRNAEGKLGIAICFHVPETQYEKIDADNMAKLFIDNLQTPWEFNDSILNRVASSKSITTGTPYVELYFTRDIEAIHAEVIDSNELYRF